MVALKILAEQNLINNVLIGLKTPVVRPIAGYREIKASRKMRINADYSIDKLDFLAMNLILR
jgi:hypothetical protein